MTKTIFDGEHGLCKFLKSDPIALAYQVLDNKVSMPHDIKGMLVQRLLKICGEPCVVCQRDDRINRYYDSEAKADVADLAVRIRMTNCNRSGRNKSLDDFGLYAVTIY